jgi:hypothetical protein
MKGVGDFGKSCFSRVVDMKVWLGWAQWFISIIPATQEAESGRPVLEKS